MTENDPNPVPPSQPRPNPVPDGVSVTPSPRPTPYMGRGDGDDTEQKKTTNPVPTKPRPKTDQSDTPSRPLKPCRWTCSRCGQHITLHITPTSPPICTRPPHRPTLMRKDSDQ
jgi:hypothetical protein